MTPPKVWGSAALLSTRSIYTLGLNTCCCKEQKVVTGIVKGILSNRLTQIYLAVGTKGKARPQHQEGSFPSTLSEQHAIAVVERCRCALGVDRIIARSAIKQAAYNNCSQQTRLPASYEWEARPLGKLVLIKDGSQTLRSIREFPALQRGGYCHLSRQIHFEKTPFPSVKKKRSSCSASAIAY